MPEGTVTAATSQPEAQKPRTANQLLVAVDLSERSTAVIEQALDFAKSMGSTVCVLHVCKPPLLLGTPTGEILPSAEPEAIEALAREELDALMRRFTDAGVPLATSIKTGEIADTIVETSNELGPRMLVLGTHGRQGIARALMGSVAEQVVRMASCPVLTIHA